MSTTPSNFPVTGRGNLRHTSLVGRRAEKRHEPSFGLQLLAFVVFLLMCYGTAAIGASWTSESVRGWYQTLAKPSWTPPDWVFGPVWTVLYFLMAVAGWLVWRQRGFSGARWALLLFTVQLVLNNLWSGIFFAQRNPGLAFAEIVVLGVAIAATMTAFWKYSRWASCLMAPYLAWSSFATVLNLAIWRLNA